MGRNTRLLCGWGAALVLTMCGATSALEDRRIPPPMAEARCWQLLPIIPLILITGQLSAMQHRPSAMKTPTAGGTFVQCMWLN